MHGVLTVRATMAAVALARRHGARSWACRTASQSRSRFNPGDDPFANNMEDDIAVRPDDAGNSTTAATALAVSVNNGFAADGIIERPGDINAQYGKAQLLSGINLQAMTRSRVSCEHSRWSHMAITKLAIVIVSPALYCTAAASHQRTRVIMSSCNLRHASQRRNINCH